MKNDFLKERRRSLIHGLACLALVSGCGAAYGAPAEAYPARPIRLLVSLGVGGVSDITARLLAQKLSESMRQQVIVDNRPSAGAILAPQALIRAEPDGYTLMVLGSSHAVSASLMKSLPYDLLRDFSPVSNVGFSTQTLLVKADSPIRSIPDLVAYAKANPGRFNIGIKNIGTMNHLTAELFKSMAGLETPLVPFKTTSRFIAAVRADEVQAIFEFLAPVLPQIESGALRALAVTSDGRHAGLPNIPTLAEAGLPGYEASAFIGVAAPGKTPKAIIDRLNREINAAIALPEMKQRLHDLGIDASGSTPEGFRKLLAADIAKWKMVIDKAKIERQ